MKYFFLFFSTFLFAFKNNLYLTVLENNLIINYLNSSLKKTHNFKINPITKTISIPTPNKFFIANTKIDSKGDNQYSIGVEFTFNKKKKKIVLTNNKQIFQIEKIFQQNLEIINCYQNEILYNLKIFFINAEKYDNFYSRFLPSLNEAYECKPKQNLLFFNLKKEKIKNYPLITLTKKREINPTLQITFNQNDSISAFLNIKIPFTKSYDIEEINKLQLINSSLNKINLLTLKINNLIDNYKEILKQNKIIIAKLKLLTLIAKISPANLNYEKLISLYLNFFNNLKTLNSIQKEILINKLSLKIEQRKISEY